MKTRFTRLEALGYWVAKRVMDTPEILDEEWQAAAEKLLAEAYRYAGLETPDWVKLKHEAREDIYEELKEAIRGYIVEQINNAYFRAVGKIVVERPEHNRYDYLDPVEADLGERVKIVLGKGLLPWARLKDDYVVLTTGFARALAKILPNITGLKSIAELLGWEFKRGVKIGRKTYQGVVVPFSEFIEFLS